MTQGKLFRFLENKPLTLLAIFIFALFVKLLIFSLVTEPIIFYKYPYFAERISNGMDIGERILDLSPFYLYANVLLFNIYGENWEALALLQIFLGSLNCLFIYLIGEKIYGKAVGFVAALFLLLYGNLTLIELSLEPEVFVLLFNSLIIFFLIQSKEATAAGKEVWRWFIIGLLIGLAAITKPNALFFMPLAVLWNWWESPSYRFRIKSTFLLLIGVAVLVSPITLRNYFKFQDFILITADSGKVFYHGNGPGATGMERADLPEQGFTEEGYVEPDYAHTLFRKVARNLTGRSLKPSDCANFWFNRALDHIRANPFSAFTLEIKKFFFFFGNYEVHDIDSTYKYYRIIQNWPLLPFGIISSLGILGMGLALPRFRQAFLLYSMVGIYLFSVLVFFAASRYRLPAVPFLATFAAYALVSIFSQWREKQFKKLLIYSGAACVLFAGTHFILRSEVQTFDRWQTATRIHYSMGGNRFFRQGLYREAVQEFEKAIALQPAFAPAYNRLGMSLAILEDYERAEKYFKKVIELSPGIDQGYLNLGLLYELKGDHSRAVPFLEKALSLNPQNQKAKIHLEKLNPRTL
ncbi:MAG: tetratricopeptide repeat protein [Thermodesulfobacteriota bacterium]|nr:tetratricopeptide repeat protein [Thermodesulfobacteriota bacterium]